MSALTTIDRPGSVAMLREVSGAGAAEWGPAGAYRYDRRESMRRETTGSHLAAFVRAGGGGSGGAARIARVELVDVSGSGLGLWSAAEAEVGARLLLYPANGRIPLDYGVVVRCERDGDGWRVGVSKGERAAA